MDVLIAICLLIAALVFVPHAWTWFVSVVTTAYCIAKVIVLLGERL